MDIEKEKECSELEVFVQLCDTIKVLLVGVRASGYEYEEPDVKTLDCGELREFIEDYMAIGEISLASVLSKILSDTNKHVQDQVCSCLEKAGYIKKTKIKRLEDGIVGNPKFILEQRTEFEQMEYYSGFDITSNNYAATVNKLIDSRYILLQEINKLETIKKINPVLYKKVKKANEKKKERDQKKREENKIREEKRYNKSVEDAKLLLEKHDLEVAETAV